MGSIYVIRNKVNDKVYIGQTTSTIEYRFKVHRYEAKKNRIASKIYKAMRELGEEQFYIEKIIDCDDTELGYWEHYYVVEYDSVNRGYNTVYPDIALGCNKTYINEDSVCTDFINGYSFAEISKRNNTSSSSINRIIEKHKLTRNETCIKKRGGKKVAVVMYDSEFNKLEAFNSIKEAVNWLQLNTEFTSSDYGMYAYISAACVNGNIAYGHRWQYKTDLIYNGIEFRSIFDIEEYKSGAKYTTLNDIAVCDDALSRIKTYKLQNKCKICGKAISSRNIMCGDCSKKNRVKANYPSDNDLQAMINKLSYEEIGRKLGVTGKAVKKYCSNRDIKRN